MAGLKERISSELIQALKQKNDVKVGTLRLFLASAHNREIEKKGKGGSPDLSDEELLEILGREAKKRKEAMEIYTKGGRPELAEKEARELKVLEEYLPAQLDAAAIESIVDETIGAMKPQGVKDFGRVMGEVMKKLKGVADPALVTKLIKDKLV